MNPYVGVNLWRKKAKWDDYKFWYVAHNFYGATYEELSAHSGYSVITISKYVNEYRRTLGHALTWNGSQTKRLKQNKALFSSECFYRNDLEDIPDVSVETARANYPKDLDAWYFDREKKHLPKEVLEVLTR